MVKQIELRFFAIHGDDKSAVEETVAALTAGFGSEQAGVAGGAVESVLGLERTVVAAQWLTRAAPRVPERCAHDPAKLGGLGEANESAEGALTVARRGVEQDAGFVAPVAGRSVDPFGDARAGVAALEGDLSYQQVAQGVEEQVAVPGPVVIMGAGLRPRKTGRISLYGSRWCLSAFRIVRLAPQLQ